MKFISALDNRLQLLFVNERSSGVNVRNHCDAKSFEFLRPIIDLNGLLADYESIRFNQKRPEHYKSKKQDDCDQRNTQPFLPTGISAPLHRRRRLPYFTNQQQKQRHEY